MSYRVANILSPTQLNPNFDIVWSFKYLLSGSSDSNQQQGGFVTYLTTSSSTFTTGGSGYFLGYDNSTANTSITGGVIGIGFDTTGLFGVSGIGSRTSGLPLAEKRSNSVSVRGNYNLLYNAHLSSLNSSMVLLTNTETYQWLRFRLGNVGQTLYVDYRLNDSDSYVELFNLPVSLYFTESSFFSVGVSYAYPLCSNTFTDSNNTILRIKNLHVEGSASIPTTYVYSVTSSDDNLLLYETGSIVSTEDDYLLLT